MKGLFININGTSNYLFHIGDRYNWWMKPMVWIMKKRFPKDTFIVSTILKDKKYGSNYGMAEIHEREATAGSDSSDSKKEPGRGNQQRSVARQIC